MAKKYSEKEVADWNSNDMSRISLRSAPRPIQRRLSAVRHMGVGARAARQLDRDAEESRQVWRRIYEALHRLVPGGVSSDARLSGHQLRIYGCVYEAPHSDGAARNDAGGGRRNAKR